MRAIMVDSRDRGQRVPSRPVRGGTTSELAVQLLDDLLALGGGHVGEAADLDVDVAEDGAVAREGARADGSRVPLGSGWRTPRRPRRVTEFGGQPTVFSEDTSSVESILAVLSRRPRPAAARSRRRCSRSRRSGPATLLGFVVVNVVPVICDACAAVSAVHTSKFFTLPDEPEFPAAAALAARDAPAALGTVALARPARTRRRPSSIRAEHAVTDAAAARVRLAAARTAATRMSSPGKFVRRG